MADPLSVASGLAGVIALTGSIIGQCYRYGCAVSDAPEEARRLSNAVMTLSGVLVAVQGLVKQSDDSLPQIAAITTECKEMLEILSSKLQKNSPNTSRSGKQVLNRLLWPLKRHDTEDLILALERQKNNLSLALNSLSVEALMQQGTSMDALSDALSELTTDIRGGVALEERRKALDWLSEYDHESQYRRGYQLHCADTCSWLLTNPEYLQWSQRRSALLWMHGQAGSGKTVATSYLIHHLGSSNKDEKPFLAYFYYDASTIESLTPETFFGAILKQFCSQLPHMPGRVLDSYNAASRRTGTPMRPSADELKHLLRAVLNDIPSSASIVIVIDGLDESPDYGAVCDFLTATVQSGLHPVRVFISSRPEVDLLRRFRGLPHIVVPEYAVEEDIGIYIRSRIEHNPRLQRMNLEMKKFVALTLQRDSHGMFRWVQCQLDEISRLRTDGAVKRALTKLPSSLEESYSRMLRNISEDEDDRLIAKRALLWLAYSSVPLRLPELAEAVRLDPTRDELDPDSTLNYPDDILEICGSLVAFSPMSQTTRIAHHSVREYLTERLDSSSSSAASELFFSLPSNASHCALAESCLWYLLLGDFSAGPLHQADLERTLQQYPLLRYAAQNWPQHVRGSGDEDSLLPLISRLMTPQSNPPFLFWLQIVLSDSKHGYLPPLGELERARPLYYAASYGLTATVRHLVNAGAPLDDRAGRFSGTAMHAAVWRGRPEIFKILLDAGADPALKDDNGSTPADLALWTGKHEMFGLFPADPRRDRGLVQLMQTVMVNHERATTMTPQEWELAQQYEHEPRDGNRVDTALQAAGHMYQREEQEPSPEYQLPSQRWAAAAKRHQASCRKQNELHARARARDVARGQTLELG